MNIRRIESTVGSHAPLIVMLAVMGTTAPAVYALAASIFHDSPIQQIALIGVSEIDLILWHLAHMHAKGAKQESISSVMTWLSVAGVVTLAGLKIILETSRSKQIPIQLDTTTIGTIIIVGLVLLIGCHLVGAISFMGADTERLLTKAEGNASYKIRIASIRAHEKTAEVIAAELARKDAADFISTQRAKGSAKLLGSVAGYNADGTPAGRLTSPTGERTYSRAEMIEIIEGLEARKTTPAGDGNTRR